MITMIRNAPSSMTAPCLFLLALLAGAPALADQVFLANGDRISGTVVAIDGTSVVVETEYAGDLVVSRDAVRAVRTDEERNVRLEGEGEVVARLSTDEAGEQTVIWGNASRTVGLAEIDRAAVAPLAERPALEWNTQADFTTEISRGNTETSAYGVLATSTLRQRRFRHTARLQVDQEDSQGITTKEQSNLRYELDWFFRDDWFIYGSGDYFTDGLRGVDPRITYGVGVGHEFWNDALGSLNARLGLSVVDETLADRETTNGALSWVLDYKRFLYGKQLEIFHNHEIRALFDADRGQLFDSSTGLRFAFSALWSANMRVDYDYATKPPAGNERSDVTYAVGLGVRF